MAAHDARIRDENFQIYLTDCLYMASAALGNKPRMRYYDILHGRPEPERVDAHTAVERLTRFGIKVVD